MDILYPWLKIAHIVSVIAWMSGLFYLPRLYVYHADATAGSELSETFKKMERLLLQVIILPAAGATVLFGVLLAFVPGMLAAPDGWFHAKVALVAGLLVHTHFLGVWRRRFAEDRNVRSSRFFRIINEIPTLILPLIVFLVVMKPF